MSSRHLRFLSIGCTRVSTRPSGFWIADLKSHDVFVSYSQPDRECAFDIVAWLEARDIGVWIAPRDVSPTAEWAEDVIDAIASSRVMVLVFSASTNESAQVRREVERAV